MFKITFQKEVSTTDKTDETTRTPETPVLDESIISKRKNKIRELRKTTCFPVINRGRLWYNKLTVAQYSELNAWYEAWLNATETLEIPKTPDWINSKLEQEDIY